jgi:hypothetical protein
MTAIDGNAPHVTDRDVDALTWEFLTFDDVGEEHVDRPLDRRLDRFLRDRGLGRLADSDDIRNILVHRAMTYQAASSPTCSTGRGEMRSRLPTATATSMTTLVQRR